MCVLEFVVASICCTQFNQKFSQGVVSCQICGSEADSRSDRHGAWARNEFAERVRQRARGAGRLRKGDFVRPDVYVPSQDGIQEELW